MTIEIRSQPGSEGRVRVVMTECPICQYEFSKYELRPRHFETAHEPGDLGQPIAHLLSGATAPDAETEPTRRDDTEHLPS